MDNSITVGGEVPVFQSQVLLETLTDKSHTRDVKRGISKLNQINPHIPVKKSSFHDSAYESFERSTVVPGASVAGASAVEEKHSPRRGKVLPGTRLAVWEKEIDEDDMERFLEVRRGIHVLLADQNAVWTRDDPKPGDMTTRIRVLGETESETAPYLIVFCSRKLYRRVRSFMVSKQVKELYDPVGLKVEVIKHPPRRTSAVLDIEVCRPNNPSMVDQITFCGSPILLVDNSDPPSCSRTRKATFGGVIEVKFDDGRLIQYGMTAGHAVEKLLNGDAETHDVDCSDDSSDEEAQTQNSVAAEQNFTQKLPDDWDWDASFDVWGSSDHAPFARIIDNDRLPGVSAGTAHLLHDWALFEIESRNPKALYNVVSSNREEKRSLMIASKPAFFDGLCDPVIMMGSHGLKRGRLSSLPGAILKGRTMTFVDTYMLELDEGYGNAVRLNSLKYPN
jgi:hypothetical protein